VTDPPLILCNNILKMGNAMRILFLRSNPVNPDSRVEKETRALAEAGHSVSIFCWDRGSNHKLEKSYINSVGSKIKIYRIGIKSVYGSGIKNVKSLFGFQKAIGRFIDINHSHYDVIHACDFDTCYTGYQKAKKYHLKVVYDVFDYYVDSFKIPSALKNPIKMIDRRLMNKADALILCTEERREQVGKLSQKNIYIVHNTPEKYEVIEKYNEVNDKLRIVYVGILGGGRLIPELLDAVANDSSIELHIAGFGQYEELAKNYADNNSNIIFYGRIPYKETINLESSCQVMTAIYDPTIRNHKYAAPNKFYEALMLGKPLIMCKGTGMSQYVSKYEFGILIDYSKEGLKAGIQYMKEHLAEFQSKSEIEQSIYDKEFNWDVMKKRLIQLYATI
jgi:glycosyltransferase involved in cell wall biosynthesis